MCFQRCLLSTYRLNIFSIGLLVSVQYCFTCTDDLSKNKVATQSTTAVSPTDVFVASKAVDRDITTCMRTILIGVNSPEKTVWWRVDLGGVYNIYSVNILFKNYNGYGIF